MTRGRVDVTMTRARDRGGDCYQVAARLVTRGLVPDGLVCHAVVTPVVGRLKGRTFDHAWVERGDRAIEQSNGLDVTMSRDAFYVLGGIDSDAVARYSADEARAAMLRTGHYGPWDSLADPPCDGFNGENAWVPCPRCGRLLGEHADGDLPDPRVEAYYPEVDSWLPK